MYGVMAGQKQDGKSKERPHREQAAEDKDNKRRGIKEKLVEYVKKRFNPPIDEELCESVCGAASHRPEPPAALARHSRFTAHEIKLMYRGFKQECPTGVVDEETFKNIFCQFFPLGDASQYAHFVFNTIKHKQTGKVNFEEFLDILSRVARGSVQEQVAWMFSLYDVDGDGSISRAEMQAVAAAVYELLGRAAAPPVPAAAQAAKEHVDKIFNLMDTDADGVVSPAELSRWVSRCAGRVRALRALDTTL